MYRDCIIADEANLLTYLNQGYEIAAVYYHELDSMVEDKEIETNQVYNPNYSYQYSGSAGGTSMEIVKKKIIKQIIRKVPKFVLSRKPIEKVLYGDPHEDHS
jgi:hypothetical protein